jgi:hypothetical protein
VLLVLEFPLHPAQHPQKFFDLPKQVFVFDARHVDRTGWIAPISPGSAVSARAAV